MNVIEQAGDGEDGSVAAFLSGLEVEQMGLPHVVVARTTSGEATASGPYAHALDAMTAAEAGHQVDRDAGGRGEVSFGVVALYPPLLAESAPPPRAGECPDCGRPFR